jgi:hypothetical protein
MRSSRYHWLAAERDSDLESYPAAAYEATSSAAIPPVGPDDTHNRHQHAWTLLYSGGPDTPLRARP